MLVEKCSRNAFQKNLFVIIHTIQMFKKLNFLFKKENQRVIFAEYFNSYNKLSGLGDLNSSNTTNLIINIGLNYRLVSLCVTLYN